MCSCKIGAWEARPPHSSIIHSVSRHLAISPGEHQGPGHRGRWTWLWAPQKPRHDGLQVVHDWAKTITVVTLSSLGTSTWLTWTPSTCQTSTGNSSSGSLMWANSRLRYIAQRQSEKVVYHTDVCRSNYAQCLSFKSAGPLFFRLQLNASIGASQGAR